ncbi:MAG TPA: type II toxin-antitoxin system RelE/ParE family toxin [Candidatus Acidoferrum sp.]|nr:type II toxin-antitoxin system RelE/ParE family toxin [Candidatus Acidoferrum sp.]
MTEPPTPERVTVHWSPEARTDLRAIDRESALQILYCLDRYLLSRTGDVKKLKPPLIGFRLRCSDYRIFFDLKNDDAIEVTAIRHRKDAYR